jgi:hypothetical protein
MAKRIFAVLISVLVLGLATSQPQAQLSPIVVDGCAKLARVVYTEVSAAAVYGPNRAGPWAINLGQGDLSVCKHTAKTVSQAFTSAMLSAGIEVSWAGDNTDSGDFCLSFYLSQCYPDRNPLSNSIIGTDSRFVQKSWAVVSQSVLREMYNPFSSDEVRFRDDDLKLRLGLSLRSIGVSASRQQHPNRR